MVSGALLATWILLGRSSNRISGGTRGNTLPWKAQVQILQFPSFGTSFFQGPFFGFHLLVFSGMYIDKSYQLYHRESIWNKSPINWLSFPRTFTWGSRETLLSGRVLYFFSNYVKTMVRSFFKVPFLHNFPNWHQVVNQWQESFSIPPTWILSKKLVLRFIAKHP